eukprot:CAMPEP_0113661564 /NCGR_PEP_ID=MMETSP0038_2-20120614/44_1 /TAXON_ID=2898 /ORGANISM="Cryptomonas paramecium" /LENGTH=73 /DNA_ID=CAMNT_0000576269 /DNA_START=52 /DNA_END=270 /DNA_ORIENTATION=- /assembly_acc=CAM_ASM_000170
MRPTSFFQLRQFPVEQMAPVRFAVVDGQTLVEDVCNPLPAWEPSWNPVDVSKNPGCKAYPEISTSTGYYADPW